MKNSMSLPYFNYGNSSFTKFVLMNAVIGSTDLMPTIMVVYHDDTYSIDSFHADIKTTIYRKINETAYRILSGGVKEVYFMNTYVVVTYNDDLLNLTSKERSLKGNEEFLAFMKVDCSLNETEYVFDGKAIKQMEYVAHQIKHGKKDKLDAGAVNMIPNVDAFKAQRDK